MEETKENEISLEELIEKEVSFVKLVVQTSKVVFFDLESSFGGEFGQNHF